MVPDNKNIRRPKRLGAKQSLWRAIAVFLFCALALLVVAVSKPRSAASTKPQNPPSPSGSESEFIILPIPLRPIAKGEKLGNLPFARTKWPKSSMTNAYITNEQDAASAVALTPLPAHLPVPIEAVSSAAGDSNAVVDGIPQGYRAITVRVDAESAVEGWARSGNYVDVIVLRQSSDREVGVEAKVIAERVKILSAGRSTEPLSGSSAAPSAPPTITLLVSQEDALKIKTAANVGKLTFSLRGTGDESPAIATAMNQKSLLGAARTIAPKAPRYVGTAKGPDGKAYVLAEDARWIRAPEMEKAE